MKIYKCCKCGAEYDLTGIHVVTLDPCPHCGGKLLFHNENKPNENKSGGVDVLGIGCAVVIIIAVVVIIIKLLVNAFN